MLLRIGRRARGDRLRVAGAAALLAACPLAACSLQPRTCEMTATDDVVDPCGVASDGSTGALPGTPDPGAIPVGTVGANGGSVDRLWFATTGDTRPARCNDTAGYPRAAIAQVAAAMKALEVQFAVDLGDHMYVCGDQGGLTAAQLDAVARAQMGAYMSGIASGPLTWWMTLGNHECQAAFATGSACAVGGPHDANFEAYMAALRRPQPWYANDVHTSLGLARFVVVADDAWGAEQSAWLSSTLADADARAKYTIVVRHHPVQGSRTGRAAIVNLLRQHKYTLVLTAHEHDYQHDPDGWQGRSAVVGLGGAGGKWGFGTVLQETGGALTFVRRDANGNPIGVPWTVTPQ